MPSVSAGSVNVEYQLGLVRDGAIQHFAGYLPGDGDTFVAAVFTDIKPSSKVAKKGLNLTAIPLVPTGSVPEKYADGQRIQVHLCMEQGECKGGKAGALHLGEWAYLSEEEDGDGGPLMSCLVAAKQKLAIPSPPPGLKPPQQFNIFTPQKPETKPAGEITQWCDKHGVPEVADTLTHNGLRAIAEVAVLSDAQLESICAGMSVGTCARLKIAVKSLRRSNPGISSPCADPGSGWFDTQTGRELPQSLMCGKDAGGPELLMTADQCAAFVLLPDSGWTEARKRPESPAAGAASGGVAPMFASPNAAAQMYSAPGFGSAGPLEEFASTARTLLRQVGGPEAAAQDLAQSKNHVVATPGADCRLPCCAPRMGVPPLTTGPPRVLTSPGASVVPPQNTGRVLAPAVSRAPAQPVSLKVLSLQGAAITEEWTSSGTIRFETAVANRTWKKTETREFAATLARTFDVAKDSGLDVAHDPAFEVPLRELAALWYADRHPNDKETADFLRESSMSLDGIPRGMWLEAKDYRKLTSRTKSSD